MVRPKAARGGLTWGALGQGLIHSGMCQTPRQFRYPRSEPDCMTRPVSEHDQPHIRSPFETAAPTSRLRRAGAQRDETILFFGISGHDLPRFVHPDPPELIRFWKI